MIGFVRGRLVHKQPPMLLVDVQGVGYEIEAPLSTFYNLPEAGQEITLFTHLSVREDAHLLFGFACEADRALFRNLIRINGVGGKLALAILSGVSSDEFARCVIEQDAVALTRVPGVGKKTAQRLVMEMRDRLPEQSLHATGDVKGVGSTSGPRKESPQREAVSALISLGYSPADAGRMVRAVAAENLVSEDIIRQALQAVVQ